MLVHALQFLEHLVTQGFQLHFVSATAVGAGEGVSQPGVCRVIAVVLQASVPVLRYVAGPRFLLTEPVQVGELWPFWAELLWKGFYEVPVGEQHVAGVC